MKAESSPKVNLQRKRKLTNISKSNSKKYLHQLKSNLPSDSCSFSSPSNVSHHVYNVVKSSVQEQDRCRIKLHRKPILHCDTTGSTTEWNINTEEIPETNAAKCSICLVTIKRGQKVGTPNTCEHKFCLDCITKRAIITSEICPVDYKIFSKFEISKTEKPTIESRSLQPVTCCMCNCIGLVDKLVFCDTCDLGFHTTCLEMESDPDESWLGPCCFDDGKTGFVHSTSSSEVSV